MMIRFTIEKKLVGKPAFTWSIKTDNQKIEEIKHIEGSIKQYEHLVINPITVKSYYLLLDVRYNDGHEQTLLSFNCYLTIAWFYPS